MWDEKRNILQTIIAISAVFMHLTFNYFYIITFTHYNVHLKTKVPQQCAPTNNTYMRMALLKPQKLFAKTNLHVPSWNAGLYG